MSQSETRRARRATNRAAPELRPGCGAQSREALMERAAELLRALTGLPTASAPELGELMGNRRAVVSATVSTVAEGRRLLDQALYAGDDPLALAVALHATRAGWNGLARRWAAARPERVPFVAEMMSIDDQLQRMR